MPNSYIVAAGAALALSVSSVTFAYSGEPTMDVPALPVMTQFDANPAATEVPQAPVRADKGRSQPAPPEQIAAKVPRDEFQSYFDSHYRAHLVLDAAAHGFFKVE